MKENSKLTTGSARYNRNFYGAVVFLLLAIVIGLQVIRFPLGEMKRVGPGFFPLVLAISLGILSLALLWISFQHNRDEEQLRWPIRWRGQVLAIASLFIYSLAIKQAGFMITTLIFTLVLFKYAYPKRWLFPLIGSLMTTVLSFILFKMLLGIPLPAGIF